MTATFTTIDEYMASVPDEVQAVLQEVRQAIHRALPGAGERISYKIPTITLDGRNVVHFAAWKKHISVYPVPTCDEAFERELARYKAAKGTLKFPLDEPVPYELIGKVAALLASGA